MAASFKPSTVQSHSYLVSDESGVIGRVDKFAKWTVRGDRIEWRAFKNNRYLGTEATRAAAAALLSR